MTESYEHEIAEERHRKFWKDAPIKCYCMCGPNPNWGEGHVAGCPIGDAQAEAQQREADHERQADNRQRA